MFTIKIDYQFLFPDSTEHRYQIEFDEKTMTYITPQPNLWPEWTKLENQKCSHCPLNESQSPHCPVAVNIASLADFFKDKISYEKAQITVITQERQYVRTTALQDGIFSIFGLIMPLSDCPYFKFLKPMARFHLPFSTPQETIVRSSALYLLKQYFVGKKSGEPDWKLTELMKHYEQLKTVNLGLYARIKTIAKKDADLNAMIVLHAFSDLLGMAISQDLATIEELFASTDS